MPERTKTSVTVNPDLWHKFQIKAVSEKKKTTVALDEALSGWIAGSYAGAVNAKLAGERDVDYGLKATSYWLENAPWHDKLERVLTSGNSVLIDAIQSNLDAFTLLGKSSRSKSQVFLAGSKQEFEILSIVERILHQVDVPSSVRQNFFALVDEFKTVDQGQSTKADRKKLLPISRKKSKKD
jgi:hypothetical protein